MKGIRLEYCIILCVFGAALYLLNILSIEDITEHTRSLLERPGKKNITVYDNGESTGGVRMVIKKNHVPSGSDFAKYLSQFVKIKILGREEDDIVADRVYTGKGTLVESFNDITDGDRLYLVAPGFLFIWPFVKQGHRVYIRTSDSDADKPLILESFNENPRVFHLYNFFNYEEADKLISRILEINDEQNKLQQSHVGHQSGKKRVSQHRTSQNAFDQVSDTAIQIRKRSFELLRIKDYDPEMCDGLQLLRYQQKQAYIPHTDYFDKDTTVDWKWIPAEGGSNRFATVFMYLSNVTKGGQTVFPLQDMPQDIPDEYKHPIYDEDDLQELNNLFEKDQWEYDMVQQCQTKLAAYPRKGHAILFYSQDSKGDLNPRSLHGGCPVLDGTKWGANLWVWNKRRFGLDKKAKKEESNKIEVEFYNPMDKAIDLYWTDTKMTSIPPNGRSQYTTYDGHIWNFKIGEQLIHSHQIRKGKGPTQIIEIPALKEEL